MGGWGGREREGGRWGGGRGRLIPVLQTSLSIADLITAALLFAQFSIQPQRALLALASGYIFSGSFAFLQTLAFPGGYAPAGLIGDGPNSSSLDLRALAHYVSGGDPRLCALQRCDWSRQPAGQIDNGRHCIHCCLRPCGDSCTDLDRDDENGIYPELLHRLIQVSDAAWQSGQLCAFAMGCYRAGGAVFS